MKVPVSKKSLGLVAAAIAATLTLSLALSVPVATAGGCEDPPFTDTFQLAGFTFSTRGTTPFWVLEPGFELTLEGVEDGEHVEVEIRVLHRTITILGRELRVVEERETKDGELVEVSRNFLAICNENRSVFYAGEDVDIYEDGEIVSHDGAWRAGVNGARGGILMPAQPLLGARYFQEVAPGVALDRAEVTGVGLVVDTPAGRFERCVATRETTPLEPGSVGFKAYAPGIGLVVDGVLRLTEYGFE